MSDTEHLPENDIRALFQKLLNSHGHPFQHAVIRRAHELEETGESRWKFVAWEFPVEVQGRTTRIDFILNHLRHDGPHGFLVAECKRAHPSFSNWCFATAPYVMRGRRSPELLFEGAKREGRDMFTGVQILPTFESVYHIPLEVKTKKGEKDDTGGRGAIEEAATQVTRGLNGLIQSLSRNLDILPTVPSGHFQFPTFFVPVIFTTARLWITGADIGLATLATGNVNLTDAKVEEKTWLWLHTHISPSLKHSLEPGIATEPPLVGGNNFARILRREYARTIAIVSTGGIDDFLGKDFLST